MSAVEKIKIKIKNKKNGENWNLDAY